MKTNLLLLLIFISFIFFGSTQYNHGIVGLTKLNGEGCLCHNLSPDPNVFVWIEGPDSVEVNQTAVYNIFLTGGPQITGGYNAASRTGIIFPGDTTSKKIDLELTHSFAKPFTNDTVHWQILYTAPSSVQWDTLYSVAQSVNNDGIPNTADRWNFGANFPVKIVEYVPVELISFSGVFINNSIRLSWTTSSELNNSGFGIEKMKEKETWEKIGFITGNNTTTTKNTYSFTDNNPFTGINYYRLKQIDHSGETSYSNIISVDGIELLTSFYLEQNYPNPFNPSTKIKYNIPLNEGDNTTLKIYDMTGKQIAVLVDEVMKAGNYETIFNASELSSGIYMYVLQSGNYTAAKKLILLK